jgi:Beta-propeller repeat/RTX calcium-binding nonapeptide repeat (4 copies)
VAEQINTFQQVYTPGSDISAASETGQLIWARTGNDFLLGYQKINPGLVPLQVDYLLGDVAIDDPKGRQWRDTFALGDWQKPYYASNVLSLYGLSEYAVITDFNPALDRVQVFGNANNYRLLDVGTGTLLLLQKPTGLDVVGFFLGSFNLNLNAPYFQYKGSTATPRVLPQVKQVGTAGYDLLVATATDRAGNVYQAGGTNGSIVGGTSNESRDAAIIKYRPDGTEAWRKQFGTSRFDTIYSIATDAQNNLYAVGVTFGNLARTKAGDVSDVFLVKYNSNGDQQWIQQFGDAGPTAVINSAFSLDTDANGNVYVSGLTARNSPGSAIPIDNFWVTKYDTNGSRQWFNEFGTTDYDEPYTTAVSNDGSVYAAGWSFGNFGSQNQGSYDGAIAKLTPQGQVEWRRNLGTSDYEWIWSADTDSQGNLYLCGWTLGSFPGNTNAGSFDSFLTKYDKNGNQIWMRQFGTAGDDQAFKLTIDNSDNIFVTGYTDSNLGGPNTGLYDAWVTRFDTNGNRGWSQQFGTNDVDQANGISVDNLGNVYVTGVTQGSLGATNAGSFDNWIAKLNATTGSLVNFGAAAPATSTQSTFAVGNTGGNPNGTDPIAATILKAVFGSFLVQQNLPVGSGGATGANVEDLFRYPLPVPGIPAGIIPTGLGALSSITSLSSTRRSTASSPQSRVLTRNATTNLNDLDNVARGFERSNDVINGRGGNDTLSGLSGDDILRGGDGDDILNGNAGRNRLVGGQGADTFGLAKENGTARVVDFNEDEGDRILLPKGLSFHQLTIEQGVGVQADHTLIKTDDQLLAIVVRTSVSSVPWLSVIASS